MNTYIWKTWSLPIGLFLLLAILLASCTPPVGEVTGVEPRLDASFLPGTTWRPIFMGTPQKMFKLGGVTLKFDEEGRIGGKIGCNYYSSMYTADGREIEIGDILITLMPCGGSDSYSSALRQANSFDLTAESLIIYYGDQGAIHFIPTETLEQPAVESTDPAGFPIATPHLENTSWTGHSISNEQEDLYISNLDVAGVQVQFADGSLNGFAGCQSFSIPYTQQGDNFSVDAAGLEFGSPDCADIIRSRLQTHFIEVLLAADKVGSVFFNQDFFRAELSGPEGDILLGPIPMPVWPGREETVVWALLRHQYPEVFDQVLSFNYELAYNRPSVSLAETRKALESAWDIPLEPSLWAHFQQRNETPDRTLDHRLIRFPHFDYNMKCCAPQWNERKLTFSRVGFSLDGRQALMYIGDEQEQLRNGRYFLLEWDNNDWRVINETTVWEAGRITWPPPPYP